MDSPAYLGNSAPSSTVGSPTMIENLTRSHFEPHVGDVFAIATEGADVPLVLNEAKPLGTALREGGAFSLSFIGPASSLLPQATYPLRHAVLGEVEIFIVPVGRHKDGVVYEAVFT
jgi:hypothetical protein